MTHTACVWKSEDKLGKSFSVGPTGLPLLPGFILGTVSGQTSCCSFWLNILFVPVLPLPPLVVSLEVLFIDLEPGNVPPAWGDSSVQELGV